MPLQQLVLADRPEVLEDALVDLADLATVGVDVERADWDRYWRAAALVQLGGQGRVVIVDPLALDDLTSLDAFLSERSTVFHAMENDLGPLASLGVTPHRVEDTAVAAALLGLPTGLETLLSQLLGVSLDGDKQAMQRANWEQRPLEPDMLAYAAGDVADLPALWDALKERLTESGRHEWYRQEVAALRAQPPAEERREWTRTKGSGRLDPLARSRLRALWDAREAAGRERDTAPGRIASDKVLVDLAVHPPTSVSELGRRGMRWQAVRDFGEQLIAAIAAAEAAGPEPRRGDTRAPTEEDRANADRLRALRADRARELGIDPGLLCPSRTLLTALLTEPESPQELRVALGLRPWQWHQLGEVFCEALGLGGAGTAGTGRPHGEEPGEARDEELHMADLLNADALHHGLDQLEGWQGTREKIGKTYVFPDEAQAQRFIEDVNAAADEMNHHPDIAARGTEVRVELSTHSAGGVTQLDLDLAARIEGLSTS